MSDDSNLEKWARLYALAKLSQAQIKANPMPHLNQMSGQVHQLREAINEALYQMSGASSYDVAREFAPTMEPSIVETATIRMGKAADVLKAALEKMDAKQ